MVLQRAAHPEHLTGKRCRASARPSMRTRFPIHPSRGNTELRPPFRQFVFSLVFSPAGTEVRNHVFPGGFRNRRAIVLNSPVASWSTWRFSPLSPDKTFSSFFVVFTGHSLLPVSKVEAPLSCSEVAEVAEVAEGVARPSEGIGQLPLLRAVRPGVPKRML